MNTNEFKLSSEQTDILESLLKENSNPDGISLKEAINNSFKKIKEQEEEKKLAEQNKKNF